MSKHIWKYVCVLMAISMVLAACSAPATPQAVEVTKEVVKEVTKVVAGTTVVEKITEVVIEQMVVTATPQPTENPYDDNAPITVWIDADRQPAFDAYVTAHPDKANLLKAVTVDRETVPGESLCCSTIPTRAGQMWSLQNPGL